MDYNIFLKQGYVSPNDHEIISDSDSSSIQNAIDAAKKCGINKVVVPKHNKRTNCPKWVITKTILIPGNITVILDDCYMVMADGVYENFFRTENIFTPDGSIPQEELENIYIYGKGNATLDGGKPNGLSEYTFLKNGLPHIALNSPIILYNVRNFGVENIAILNQRYWAMRLTYCKNGSINNIYICAVRDRNNQDGIDLRNGCNNIIIENITAQTGDDTVALSGLDVMRNDKYNMIFDRWDNDIHHITIRNIKSAALIHPIVALRNHNGVKLHDILIENISDIPALKPCEVTVNVQKGQTVTSTFIEDVGDTDHIEKCDYSKLPRYAMIHIGDKAYYSKRHSVMGETYNIRLNNISCNYSERAVVLGCEIKDLCIESITASGECKYVVSTCPDGINGGPFVKLENVFVNNVSFKAEANENTAAFYFGDLPESEYIKNMTVSNVCTENAEHFAVLAGNVELKIKNQKNINLSSHAVKIIPGSEDSVKMTW